MSSQLLVVDTSIAYKWFSDVDESDVEEAASLLDQQLVGALRLCAPSSMVIELANGLRYSSHERSVVLAILEEFDLAHIEFFEVNPERLHAAGVKAYRHDISVCDALFLALAEELDCPLVTADRRAFANIDTPVEIRLL